MYISRSSLSEFEYLQVFQKTQRNSTKTGTICVVSKGYRRGHLESAKIPTIIEPRSKPIYLQEAIVQ